MEPKRHQMTLAILFTVIVGSLQSAYWMEAVIVAEHATVLEGEMHWTSGGPPGTFYPWPREPGLLTVMTPMTDPINQLIFSLIRLWLFVPIALGITALFGYLGWYLGGRVKPRLKLTSAQILILLAFYALIVFLYFWLIH